MEKHRGLSKSRIINDLHIIKSFLKCNFLNSLFVEGALILSALFVYFSTAPFGKVFNFVFLGISILSMIGLFLITFRLFIKFEKTELAKKDKDNVTCFFFYFTSLFFSGALFTIVFLIVKAVDPTTKFLIQGIQYIIEMVCLFLVFGLGVYLPKVLNSLHKKGKGNLEI